eukprot:c20139_g1_i2 orf=139-1155(+)
MAKMLQRCRFPQSAYLSGLVQEVQRKLQKALNMPTQRGELLRQLFTDLALEVDARAQALLYNHGNVVEDGNAIIDDSRPSLCFYEVLAEHYAQMPEEGKSLLPLFVQMWSQSFSSQIFALLFYQWLFEVPQQSDGFVRYPTAFIEGATAIFWIDVQSNERRFFSLYHYAYEEVTVNSGHLNKLPIQAQRELIHLISRFFFFYEPADRLKIFLKYIPAFSSFPTGGPADVFVIELTAQLQKIKVEPVLLHYLRCSKVLKGVELHVTTSTRLKSALYSFTSPGGPMYPTRPIRHAAWDTLDCLYPVGQRFRHLISLSFRLLHPYYWPSSFGNFVLIWHYP